MARRPGGIPRAGALLLLSGLALSQCRKQEAAPKRSPVAQLDPNANGERLRSAERDWPRRWQAVEALPDCTPLLPEPAQRSACEEAVSAVNELRAALSRDSSAAELIERSARTASKAQRATQHLRRAGMAELVESRRPTSGDARPLASALPSAASAAHATHPGKGAASALPSALPPRQQQSPMLDAITSYARVANLALRQLGVYLELAPRAVRRAALDAVAKLSEEEPNWAGLRALVREASLVEPDPDLKQRLVALGARLGAG